MIGACKSFQNGNPRGDGEKNFNLYFLKLFLKDTTIMITVKFKQDIITPYTFSNVTWFSTFKNDDIISYY